MMCHRIGRPPISTIGLGRNSVSSRNRVPSPPHRMTTFIEFPPNNLLRGRLQFCLLNRGTTCEGPHIIIGKQRGACPHPSITVAPHFVSIIYQQHRNPVLPAKVIDPCVFGWSWIYEQRHNLHKTYAAGIGTSSEDTDTIWASDSGFVI